MEGPGTDPWEHGGAPVRAAEVFTAELLPRPVGPLRRGVGLAGSFVVGLVSGVVPAPAEDDVVVLRRDDGSEVLRVPAGEPEAAGVLLRSVRSELQELSPEAFLRAWAVR